MNVNPKSSTTGQGARPKRQPAKRKRTPSVKRGSAKSSGQKNRKGSKGSNQNGKNSASGKKSNARSRSKKKDPAQEARLLMQKEWNDPLIEISGESVENLVKFCNIMFAVVGDEKAISRMKETYNVDLENLQSPRPQEKMDPKTNSALELTEPVSVVNQHVEKVAAPNGYSPVQANESDMPNASGSVSGEATATTSTVFKKPVTNIDNNTVQSVPSVLASEVSATVPVANGEIQKRTPSRTLPWEIDWNLVVEAVKLAQLNWSKEQCERTWKMVAGTQALPFTPVEAEKLKSLNFHSYITFSNPKSEWFGAKEWWLTTKKMRLDELQERKYKRIYPNYGLEQTILPKPSSTTSLNEPPKKIKVLPLSEARPDDVSTASSTKKITVKSAGIPLVPEDTKVLPKPTQEASEVNTIPKPVDSAGNSVANIPNAIQLLQQQQLQQQIALQAQMHQQQIGQQMGSFSQSDQGFALWAAENKQQDIEKELHKIRQDIPDLNNPAHAKVAEERASQVHQKLCVEWLQLPDHEKQRYVLRAQMNQPNLLAFNTQAQMQQQQQLLQLQAMQLEEQLKLQQQQQQQQQQQLKTSEQDAVAQLQQQIKLQQQIQQQQIQQFHMQSMQSQQNSTNAFQQQLNLQQQLQQQAASAKPSTTELTSSTQLSSDVQAQVVQAAQQEKVEPSN